MLFKLLSLKNTAAHPHHESRLTWNNTGKEQEKCTRLKPGLLITTKKFLFFSNRTIRMNF